MHTVTSADGTSFSSDPLDTGAVFKLDTANLALGKYDYACSFHPWMAASFELVEQASDQRLAEGATATDPNSIPAQSEPETTVEEPADQVPETTPEAPVEETPVEEAPATEAPVEEQPIETPVETPSEETSAPAAEATVEMAVGASSPTCADTNSCYLPHEITISVGGTVTWINNDSAAHFATSGKDATADGKFDSGMVMASSKFSQKFDTAGTYDYFCTVHPWMTGTVIVG